MKSLSFLLLLLFAIPSLAEDLTTDETRLKETMARNHAESLALIDAEIADCRRVIKESINIEQRKNVTLKLTEQITARKRATQLPWMPPMIFLSQLKIGQVGYMTGGNVSAKRGDDRVFRVVQVVDNDSMFIRCSDGWYTDHCGAVREIVKTTVLVSGINTAAIIDDSNVEMKQLFEVTGTNRNGGKTIFELKPFRIQNIDAVIEKIKAAEKK